MKISKLSLFLFLLLFFIGFTQVNGQDSADPDPQPDKQAYQKLSLTFLKAFIDGDYATFSSMLDEKMQGYFTEKAFNNSKKQMSNLGKYKSFTKFTMKEKGEHIVTESFFEFENMSVKAMLYFDKENKIAGLQFYPIQKKHEYTPPKYVDKNKFTEKEIKIGEGEWELPGTLSMPVGEGKFPAVVLVHGSGPSDRDEAVYKNMPFRDIAWGLASAGVAVVRYDKRTKVHASKIVSAFKNFTVQGETIDDALLAVNLLRETEKIDTKKIFVIGHSLGGMLIPRIGNGDKKIAGLISLAGPTRHLADLFVYQYIYIFGLDGKITDDEMDVIEKIIEIRDKTKDENLSDDIPYTELMTLPPSYWKDLQKYNPAEYAKNVKQPMLFLQGERDYQVTMKDFNGWKKALSARKNVTFKSYEKLNHLFLEGTGQSKPAEYMIEGHIPDYVIKDIAEWINSNPKPENVEPKEQKPDNDEDF